MPPASRPPRMTSDDVGAFYTRPDDGSIWRLITYAADPTATLERVFPTPTPTEQILGQRVLRGGVVGARIFEGFVRLAAEGDERPVVGLVDPELAFWRGRPYAPDGVPSHSISTHDAPARCPVCSQDAESWPPVYSIKHDADCRGMQALRLFRGHEG